MQALTKAVVAGASRPVTVKTRLGWSEESIKILNQEIKSLKKKEAKYDYAFRRGFQKGFYISFCALHGQILLDPDDEDFEILKNDPYRISKGSQLDLFR